MLDWDSLIHLAWITYIVVLGIGVVVGLVLGYILFK